MSEAMIEPANNIDLPRAWYGYCVAKGAEPGRPGLYEWRIEGSGSYIGKYKRIRRPTQEYGRNVTRLLRGLPYRRGKPEGFRRIHRELELALREGRAITLIILENPDPPSINRRERELIADRGALNDPPFGRWASN